MLHEVRVNTLEKNGKIGSLSKYTEDIKNQKEILEPKKYYK